jgi:hypothetical protein
MQENPADYLLARMERNSKRDGDQVPRNPLNNCACIQATAGFVQGQG